MALNHYLTSKSMMWYNVHFFGFLCYIGSQLKGSMQIQYNTRSKIAIFGYPFCVEPTPDVAVPLERYPYFC